MQTEATELTHTEMDADLDAIVAEIDERGYCLIPSAISVEQADEIRSILERFLEAERKESHLKAGYQRVGRIAVKHPVFVDLMCHPLIVDVWKKWLGEDVICSTWSANTIFPGHESIGWHADFPYWAITPPWPTGKLTGQTIWLLDDFTEENGGTGVIPYSHHNNFPPDRQNEWRDDAEIITGTCGSVVVLHGGLWHTARPNRSDRPRSALLGMYIRPCCVPMENLLGQLDEIDNPSDIAKQLMGAKQRQPRDIE
ncbi:MAG: phytanoyl-CoA dioxygenase family protein [Candidatus Latescibacteria bacterium]|nr:phytanoyl-CoA dioxygenase family protein [Candidatus Latescibacterota bacterium]